MTCFELATKALTLFELSGCPSYAVHYNGMCYASMDQTNADSTDHSCQTEFITMPEGWQLVPFSTQVLQSVVQQHHFGTDVVVFANGAGYRTISGTLFGDAESKFVKSGNQFKTPWCNYKVLMQKSDDGASTLHATRLFPYCVSPSSLLCCLFPLMVSWSRGTDATVCSRLWQQHSRPSDPNKCTNNWYLALAVYRAVYRGSRYERLC